MFHAGLVLFVQLPAAFLENPARQMLELDFQLGFGLLQQLQFFRRIFSLLLQPGL